MLSTQPNRLRNNPIHRGLATRVLWGQVNRSVLLVRFTTRSIPGLAAHVIQFSRDEFDERGKAVTGNRLGLEGAIPPGRKIPQSQTNHPHGSSVSIRLLHQEEEIVPRVEGDGIRPCGLLALYSGCRHRSPSVLPRRGVLQFSFQHAADKSAGCGAFRSQGIEFGLDV